MAVPYTTSELWANTVLKSIKESRECASKAFALCFFPEDFIEHAIDYIENFASVTGSSAAYFKDLVAYLRRVWLPKRIR